MHLEEAPALAEDTYINGWKECRTKTNLRAIWQ